MILSRPGWIARGTVFDANPKRISRELRDYDNNLRLIWNPDDKKGQGGWEIHWSPSWTLKIEEGDIDWTSRLYSFKEVSPTRRTKIHFDIPYLHSNLVGEMRARDSWSHAGDKTKAAEILEKTFSDNEKSEEQKLQDQIKRETRDQMKDEKKYIQAYKGYVASGVNPLWFFK